MGIGYVNNMKEWTEIGLKLQTLRVLWDRNMWKMMIEVSFAVYGI